MFTSFFFKEITGYFCLYFHFLLSYHLFSYISIIILFVIQKLSLMSCGLKLCSASLSSSLDACFIISGRKRFRDLSVTVGKALWPLLRVDGFHCLRCQFSRQNKFALFLIPESVAHWDRNIKDFPSWYTGKESRRLTMQCPLR